MTMTYTGVLSMALLALGLAGALSGNHDHQLLMFGVNANHNAVHLLAGLLGACAALAGVSAASGCCLLFAALYGVVGLAGLADYPPVVHALNLTPASVWLYLMVAAAALAGGILGAPQASPRALAAGALVRSRV